MKSKRIVALICATALGLCLGVAVAAIASSGKTLPARAGVTRLTASASVSANPTSYTISWNQPKGTIARDVWFRLKVTTPTGACDSEPEAGSVVGNYSLNGDTSSLGGFNQTFFAGTTSVPSIGSVRAGYAALPPGHYEFTTDVTNSNLVAPCFGTVFRTEIFVETVAAP